MHSPQKRLTALAALLLFVLSACQGPTGPRFPDPTGPKDGEEGDQSLAPIRTPTVAQVNGDFPKERGFTSEWGRFTASGEMA